MASIHDAASSDSRNRAHPVAGRVEATTNAGVDAASLVAVRSVGVNEPNDGSAMTDAELISAVPAAAVTRTRMSIRTT